jgi:hypothetical protein
MPQVIPIVAAAVEAIGLGFGPMSLAAGTLGISEGALAIGSVLTYGGLAAGTAVASSALQRSLKPDLPGQLGAQGLSSLNAPEVKVSVKQSAPAQRIVRGRQRTGGAFAFYKKVPGTGKLVIQHMYSRRKWSRVIALHINGNRITFSTTPFGSILSPLDVEGQPDYPGKLRVCFQDGSLSQPTNPLLVANFPDLASTPGWRLPGIANAAYEFAYGANFDEHEALWGNVQIPAVEVEGEWCPVYDPRRPGHRLPRDPDDLEEWHECQQTWEYSANAALHVADHLWQPDGLNAGPEGVDWDKVAEAADRCDEACAMRDTVNTGIFERRYEVAGVVTLDQQVADVCDGLLTACRASLIQGNTGKVWVSHDAPAQEVLTITDDMIVGAVSYRGFKSRRELANKTVTRYIAQDRDYQQSDAPPLVRADLIEEDGGELPLTVTLPFTPSSSMAQRIAKADLEEARIEYTWTGVVDLRALGAREDDIVRIDSRVCPHWNGLYRVDRWRLNLSLRGQSGIGLELVGYDPSIVADWNPANDDLPVDLTDTDALLAA